MSLITASVTRSVCVLHRKIELVVAVRIRAILFDETGIACVGRHWRQPWVQLVRFECGGARSCRSDAGFTRRAEPSTAASESTCYVSGFPKQVVAQRIANWQRCMSERC